MRTRNLVAAVDIGGTKISTAVVGPDGTIYAKEKAAVRKADVEESVAQIADCLKGAVGSASVSWDRIEAAGVIVPGIYFAESGNAWAPNLWGWDQVPLRATLEARLPVPVTIDSDRAGYVLGEQWMGVAAGLSDVVFLAIGTGIGAGILARGQLIRGAGDVAGAVGWFALNPCWNEAYGRSGCWESESSGSGVARRAAERILSGQSSAISSRGITAQAVVDAARAGDRLAREVIAEATGYLAMGIANIVSLLNPQMIVLGGGLMQAGDLFLEPLRQAVPRWAQPISAHQVRIELTQLGEDAGLLGAARLALGRACSGT